MLQLPNDYNTPIKDKDGKYHLCCPELVNVRGGKNIVYVTEAGIEVKREPLHRYKNRINRRKIFTRGDNMNLKDAKDLPKEQLKTKTKSKQIKMKDIMRAKPQSETKPKQKRDNIIRIYHGNPDPDFEAYYGGGMEYHDYGKGLYCMEDIELAKEWACQYADLSVSYVYIYSLDLTGLPPIFDLNDCPPVYWISALAEHRFEKDEPLRRKERREQLIKTFPIDCKKYEIIKGWRADDSYYAYLRNFLRGDYSYEATIQAMELGNLGQQIVIKGRLAYNNCKKSGRIIIEGDNYIKYLERYNDRDNKARNSLQTLADVKGLYIEDVISEGERGRWKVDL